MSAPPDGRPSPPAGWAGVALAVIGVPLLVTAALINSELLLTGGVALVAVGVALALYNFTDARRPPSPRPFCDGCGRPTRRAAAFCPTCGRRTTA